MSDIVLATLNAKYIHAAFGLRYLYAQLGDLQQRSLLAEFDINQRPIEIAERILAAQPRIVGFGVYIWNASPTSELISILKSVRPDLIVILGGPEVSYETEEQEIVRKADYVITGEADLAFAELCNALLKGESPKQPKQKVLAAPLPTLDQLKSPYAYYSDDDLKNRVLYVEASRGCPFTCEFCLSSLDIPVRAVPLKGFLESMQALLDRGARQFKFVDRTFNLHLPTSTAILNFFLERWTPGLFVHFEMVPDRLPDALREIIARFPSGALQFEVGVQSLNPEVEHRISRRQNQTRMEENFQFLRTSTGVHVHADLIVGLPGEDLPSFGAGFDRLLALGPQEIQIGILKRLRGTPIARHTDEYKMIYSPLPPYEVLSNRHLNFESLATMRRFAKFWDIYGNSGLFPKMLPLLWRNGTEHRNTDEASPFRSMMAFSEWLTRRGVKTSGIAQLRQFELLAEYLSLEKKVDDVVLSEAIRHDYRKGNRRDTPGSLSKWLDSGEAGPRREHEKSLPKRQRRHLAVSMELGEK